MVYQAGKCICVCINTYIPIIYLHLYIIMVSQAVATHSGKLSWYCVMDYVVNNMVPT